MRQPTEIAPSRMVALCWKLLKFHSIGHAMRAHGRASTKWLYLFISCLCARAPPIPPYGGTRPLYGAARPLGKARLEPPVRTRNFLHRNSRCKPLRRLRNAGI